MKEAKVPPPPKHKMDTPLEKIEHQTPVPVVVAKPLAEVTKVPLAEIHEVPEKKEVLKVLEVIETKPPTLKPSEFHPVPREA
jgi:hypothetical protein